ncbi:MAG: hypothetical protein JRI23_12490 [Deltaproteobacteria bacterium]|nr:hypothetical protein [Deltaproteobacteria bacterium]
MGGFDRTFRALAIERPEVITALLEVCVPGLLPPGTEVVPEQVDSPSLIAPPALEADWVARAGEELVLHVEAQGYSDASFLERLFRYHLGIVLRYPDRRVQSVALWIRPPAGNQRVTDIEYQGVRVRVTSVVLSELSAQLLLAYPRTACLAVGADPGNWTIEELCHHVVAELAEDSSAREKALAVGLAMSMGREDAMIQAMKDAEMELPILQEFVAYGEERGDARGYERGRVEATRETLVSALLTVLRARGLTITDEVEKRIADCQDVAQLEEWLRRAGTAQSLSDVFD